MDVQAPTTNDTAAFASIIPSSLRRWRKACDAGVDRQPYLALALDSGEGVMLAPVLDSLFGFYEAALARPVEPGEGSTFSADEARLIRLIINPKRCAADFACPAGVAACLGCALCSTGIMLASASDRSAQ